MPDGFYKSVLLYCCNTCKMPPHTRDKARLRTCKSRPRDNRFVPRLVIFYPDWDCVLWVISLFQDECRDSTLKQTTNACGIRRYSAFGTAVINNRRSAVTANLWSGAVVPLILVFHGVSIQFYVNDAAWKGLYIRRVGYPECCTLKAMLEMEAGFRNVGNAYHVYVVRSLKQDQPDIPLV